MLNLILWISARISANSFLNVFQKILTQNGEFASIINFFTYLGLTILSFLFCQNIILSPKIILLTLLMGFLGCLGNLFIIKSLK